MNRSLPTAVLAVALVLSASSLAQSVPDRVTFTARLQDNGVPVTGVQAVQFSLFDVTTGGVSLWSETQAVTFASDGVCFVALGAVSPLNSTVLDGRRLFLEVTVGSTTFTPRLAVVSVPYAIRAHTAYEAGRLGALQPGDVQLRVGGTCSAGQAIRAIDATGAVTCQATGSAYTGSAPVSVSGTTIGLNTCGANQLYKMNAGGTAWACGPDSDTAPTATAPIGVAGNSVFLTTCTAGQILKMVGGVWACAADVDTNTTYTATAPIAISGANDISLAAGGVTTSHLADNSVTSAKIAADTIIAADIAAGAVTSAEIADATIADADLATGAVTGSKILDGTITAADIATDAVGGSELASVFVNGTIAVEPVAPLIAVNGTDLTFDASAATYELCVLSVVSVSGGVCSVTFVSASSVWRLSALTGGPGDVAQCQMMCFNY